MRTMKDVKHQMQQLLVAIETPAPHHHPRSTPSQLKIPVGPSTLSSRGAGAAGSQGPSCRGWSTCRLPRWIWGSLLFLLTPHHTSNWVLLIGSNTLQ